MPSENGKLPHKAATLATATWGPKVLTNIVGTLVMLVFQLVIYAVSTSSKEREATSFDVTKMARIIPKS